MKMLIAAIAMVVASPAIAQGAPMANQAGHTGHAAQDASSGQVHTAPPTAPTSDPHAGHDMSAGEMDCCKKATDGRACCAKMKTGVDAMPCCDKAKAEGNDTSARAEGDPHAGHNMPSR